jgi:transcriptional regulator with XRE-family HTH domain
MLSDYVNRVMEEKGLTAKDIERRSKGKITDSTIGNIRAGRNKNLSLDKINALALGLDVSAVEVFLAASGQRDKRELTASRLSFIVQKLVDNSELFRLVESLVKQKPAKIKVILKSIESEND